MKIVKIFIAFVVVVFLFYGCAGTNNTINSQKEDLVLSTNNISKNSKLAKDYFIKGSILEQLGQFDEAVTAYSQALLYDETAGMHFVLGSVYMKLRKFALAAIQLKRAVEMDSLNEIYQLKIAELYSITYQEDEAEKIYDRLIQKDSANSEALYRLANLVSLKKPLKALELYEKFIKTSGEDLNVYLSMADINNKLGNSKKAAEMLEKILFLAPGNEIIENALLDLYLQDKNFKGAKNILEDKLIDDPENYSAREILAQIYVEEGNWEKASGEFEKLLKVDSVDINVKYRIALTFFEKSFDDSTYHIPAKLLFQNIDSAFSNWKSCLYLAAVFIKEKDTLNADLYFSKINGIEEGMSEIWSRIGGLFFDKRKYRESIYLLEKGYKYFSNDYLFNFITGLGFLQLDQFKESYTYLSRAADINSKEVGNLSALGFVLGKLKRYDEAIIILKKALDISPRDLNVLSTLATIYDNTKRFEECDSIYKKAFEYYPDNALLLNNYAYSLAERKIQLNEALEYSKKAVKQDSTNDSYLDTLGWIYFQMGDLQNAEKYVRMAVDAGSTSAEVLEHMGDIYYKLGNPDLAKAYWQKAFEKDNTRESVKTRLEQGKI